MFEALRHKIGFGLRQSSSLPFGEKSPLLESSVSKGTSKPFNYNHTRKHPTDTHLPDPEDPYLLFEGDSTSAYKALGIPLPVWHILRCRCYIRDTLYVLCPLSIKDQSWKTILMMLHRWYKFGLSLGEATNLARMWKGDGKVFCKYTCKQWEDLYGDAHGWELYYQIKAQRSGRF